MSKFLKNHKVYKDDPHICMIPKQNSIILIGNQPFRVLKTYYRALVDDNLFGLGQGVAVGHLGVHGHGEGHFSAFYQVQAE